MKVKPMNKRNCSRALKNTYLGVILITMITSAGIATDCYVNKADVQCAQVDEPTTVYDVTDTTCSPSVTKSARCTQNAYKAEAETAGAGVAGKSTTKVVKCSFSAQYVGCDNQTRTVTGTIGNSYNTADGSACQSGG